MSKLARWRFLGIFSVKIGSLGLEDQNRDNPEKSGGLVSMYISACEVHVF